MLGVSNPFVESYKILKKLTLIEVPPKMIETITQETGDKLEKYKEKKVEESWKVFENSSQSNLLTQKTSNAVERLYI